MISLSGPALHAGVSSTVRFVLRPDDGLGIRFRFPGFAAPLDARALSSLHRGARRATVLSDGNGATIRTPEHLLAAALFFAEEPIDVFCDADEPPGLDGSARPFFDLFGELAPDRRACREYDTELTWNHAGREGELRAEPAPRFSITYALERGSFREFFHLNSAAAAPAEILPARTFIFWKDWKSLTDSASPHPNADGALLSGAGSGAGLLLAESPEEFAEARAALPESPETRGNTFPLLHPGAYRLASEAARHKILDLLGDLALRGLALPKLRLEIRNGGHALNHLLLEQLLLEQPEAPAP